MHPPAHTPAREAVEAPPWREDSRTPRPAVHVYPVRDRPALWVYAAGEWRLARVLARQRWADRTLVYQVEIALPDDQGVLGVYVRAYGWPQEALMLADPGPGQ